MARRMIQTQRGCQERKGYADQLMADYKTVMENATTDEQRVVATAFAEYRQRIKAMKLATLQAPAQTSYQP